MKILSNHNETGILDNWWYLQLSFTTRYPNKHAGKEAYLWSACIDMLFEMHDQQELRENDDIDEIRAEN